VAAAPGSVAVDAGCAGFAAGFGAPSGGSSAFTSLPPNDHRKLSEASTFST
jgi:hypothetical protein